MAIRMRQRVFLIIGVLLGALLNAGNVDASLEVVRGTGRIAVEMREVSGFSGVVLHTVGDLEIEIANHEDLRIEAEENLLEYIETEVVDGVLIIKQLERTRLKPSKPVRFHLNMRKLDHVVHTAGGHIHIPRIATKRLRVEHSGSGKISVTELELGSLTVHASGSGKVELYNTAASRCRLTQSGSGGVTVRYLKGLSNDVRLTGSGDISISDGNVVQQSAIVSGSGAFKGAGLRTSETEVMVSGSGSAFIHAKDQLDATITGGGDIRYRGSPHVVRSISGSGKLKKIR